MNHSYCGFIAIIGKSNVGKSTLLNRLVGNKISITADRPQTTRHKILGIKTINNKQAIYIDTPGITHNNHSKLNKLMNKAAKSSYKDADLIIFMVESLTCDLEDEAILENIIKLKRPATTFLIFSKLDLVKDENLLLPKVQELNAKYPFTEVFPISVKNNFNIDKLEEKIFSFLPEAPHYFLDNHLTDKDLNFRIAEVIREKLIKNLEQELPYATHVEIVSISKNRDLYKIHANIWVEKVGQKKIVIGKNGCKLKIIGTQARIELEKTLKSKIFLNLFVQVKSNWTNNDLNLKNLNIII